jgi:hypothetical protein
MQVRTPSTSFGHQRSVFSTAAVDVVTASVVIDDASVADVVIIVVVARNSNREDGDRERGMRRNAFGKNITAKAVRKSNSPAILVDETVVVVTATVEVDSPPEVGELVVLSVGAVHSCNISQSSSGNIAAQQSSELSNR